MSESPDMADYDAYLERMRETEYPMLKDALYLDHAGTTPYSKTLMERFHADMMAHLYGNSHSMSPSSQRSTLAIEAVRLQALNFFDADPEHFDLVFTSNTTAAIKLVMDAFREHDGGFWYGYHVDSHTSLVGVRESARSHRCFESDEAVCNWLEYDQECDDETLQLFAYPAQSNMNGRRLPLEWSQKQRTQGSLSRRYVLLDAAAYAATSHFSLSDVDLAPDFTVVSFSKIFGFPDLGALLVKKDAAHLFERRSYFGGGTVDMVLCLEEQWHIPKTTSLHERLEDGTLPIHNILALEAALWSHRELFRSMHLVARHTSALTKLLCDGLNAMRHADGKPVTKIYSDENTGCEALKTSGPIVAFNLRDSHARWVSNAEVEKLASIRNIHLRTGGVCNPGGIATALNLAPWEMHDNFSAGFRCGSENDIMNGRPTGVVRVSFGAMSTRSDVQKFLAFMNEFFIDGLEDPGNELSPKIDNCDEKRFYVESLTVYPIKSCAGWRVPYDQAWDVHAEGLAWDREWCLVRLGTGTALSQKIHPRMALIRPRLDFEHGLLHVGSLGFVEEISVPLSKDPRQFGTDRVRISSASICGDSIKARIYTSKEIAEFFTRVLGTPCTLARYPSIIEGVPSGRHSKAHLHLGRSLSAGPHPILLSNESPILMISRSSLNRLNETIKDKGGGAVDSNVFRANIIVAENPFLPPGQELPWAEDHWSAIRIGSDGGPMFDLLGGCRRCQMICIDQESGQKNQEPFVTLAKIRRFDGKVLFGVHTSLVSGVHGAKIKAGDQVQTLMAER